MTSQKRWLALALGAVGLIGLASSCDEQKEASAEPPSAEPWLGLPDDLAVPDRLASSRDAVADFTKTCDSGDGLACSELGKHYLGRPGAAETALASFAKACKAGQQDGCNNQAVMELRRDRKNKKVIQQAADLLQKACDGGEAAACANLALLFQDLLKGAAARSQGPAQKGCELGFERACILEARSFAVAKGADPSAVTKSLETACAAKRVGACRLLGKPAPETDLFDEIEPIVDPFACSNEGWLAKMAEGMKLESFTRAAEAPADKADCDLWTVR